MNLNLLSCSVTTPFYNEGLKSCTHKPQSFKKFFLFFFFFSPALFYVIFLKEETV